jgi:hypothetical protein
MVKKSKGLSCVNRGGVPRGVSSPQSREGDDRKEAKLDETCAWLAARKGTRSSCAWIATSCTREQHCVRHKKNPVAG